MTTPDDDTEYLTLSVALSRVPISRRQLYRYAKDGRIRVRPVIGGGQVYNADDVEQLAQRLRADREKSTAVTPARRDTDRAELVALREELREVVREEWQQASQADREVMREQGERLDRAISAFEQARQQQPALQQAPPWRAILGVLALVFIALAVLVTLLVLRVL
jgi:hypothetical protein